MTTHVIPISTAWDGDRHERFRQLFISHFDALYRYAFHFLENESDAEDALQDVFLQVWRTQPNMENPTDFLYRAVRNTCINQVRRRSVADRYLARWWTREDALVPMTPWADDALENQEWAASIQRAIDTLPRRQREVLQLRWHEGLSYEEIGSRLGIATKTVAEHRNRAVAHLRESLPGMLE